MENKKNCLECGRVLMGRADKKFCSDLCRNTFNNRMNSFSNNTIKNTNHALKKNRRILSDICAENKIKTTRKTLISKGFDFNFLTHLRKTQKGNTYYFIYDLGYLELDNDFILIVRDSQQ